MRRSCHAAVKYNGSCRVPREAAHTLQRRPRGTMAESMSQHTPPPRGQANRGHILRTVAAVLLAACCAGAVPATADRPRLTVSDPAAGCPSVTGRFVALLDADRGILLLSAAPFPGGRPVTTAAGGPLQVDTGDGGRWNVVEATVAGAPSPLWASRSRFRERAATGCVAFDADRFSAAGDLASYVHWLAETVFARLPADETGARPPLRLAGREVRLRVGRAGSAPIELAGREGATLAFRFADSERVYLAIPYVLETTPPRLAVEIGSSQRPYWEPGAKQMLGFRVVAAGAPAAVDELGITVAVLGVDED